MHSRDFSTDWPGNITLSASTVQANQTSLIEVNVTQSANYTTNGPLFTTKVVPTQNGEHAFSTLSAANDLLTMAFNTEDNNKSHILTWYIYVPILFCLILIFIMIILCMIRRRKDYKTIELPEEIGYEYIYKPLISGINDEDYENTFVGVSIPLLQDVSRV